LPPSSYAKVRPPALVTAQVREQVRGRKGKPGPLNRVWGLDLTGKTDGAGKLHMILGLVDHGSRLNLSLQVLKTKSSIAMLRILLDVIERFGMPTAVRTDNEACFTSRLFRFGLRVLGIQHQTTDLHCPWMNGRVERFFGTLKERLNHWRVPDREALNRSLAEFRTWYNFVRPHQSLYGRTPAEIWNGTDVYRRKHNRAYWFSAWDGLLQGIYIPCAFRST
jgi:putative transposase